MPAARRIAAFTLVELLVVIAIIGVLVSMLLPAVQSARAAARLKQCSHHLRQLGLAIHGYHDVMGNLPPGYIANAVKANTGPGAPGNGGDNRIFSFIRDDDDFGPPPTAKNLGEPGPGWGWGAHILDGLEQVSLKSSINFAADICGQSASATFLRVFVCPSDTGPNIFEVKDISGNLLGSVARSNYVAMFGMSEILDVPDYGEGTFFRNSHVRMAEITDGTSNTLAIGERATNLAYATWTGAVNNGIVKNLSKIPGADDQPGPVFVLAHTGTVIEGQLPNNSMGHADDFTSRHPGGVNFLFVDGSVRFINNNIHEYTWVALGTRAGGETMASEF